MSEPALVTMMEEERFWDLIARSRAAVDASQVKNGDQFQDRQAEALSALLRQLSPEEVIGFDMRRCYYGGVAYRWELWGAAYWAHGGCGDDSFTDFRNNLISLGREPFFAILHHPDELAGYVDRPDVPYMLGEGFAYLPGRVYEELTGREVQEQFDRYPRGPREPAGERWDFDEEEEAERRFPKLYEKYPDMGD